MNLPKDYKELAYTIHKWFGIKNILIVNTPKTGEFLNEMFLDKRSEEHHV